MTRLFSPLFVAALLLASPAIARDPPTPEQRIHKLERQVRSINRKVFPDGEPAEGAGFSDAPAATKDSVDTLTGRLEAVEKQLSELVRTSEENGNRLSTMETELARLRAEQDSRFKALESGTATGGPTTGEAVPEPIASPVRQSATTPPPAPASPPPPGTTDFTAGGEAAYDQGFNLWTAGQYDQAITQLRAMASSFPGHRRVSWANNLVGRALLDKGQPRAAAEALLANYRGNPKGERAPDSLFYLGQALVKLGQPAQACKAYSELSEVYGSSLRPQLKSMLKPARSQAKCG